jgi:hypothetical protein
VSQKRQSRDVVALERKEHPIVNIANVIHTRMLTATRRRNIVFATTEVLIKGRNVSDG